MKELFLFFDLLIDNIFFGLFNANSEDEFFIFFFFNFFFKFLFFFLLFFLDLY